METAKNNDRVVVTFTGTTEDGELFDAATEENPLSFELGSEVVIPAFSAAICGMGEGESKEFAVAAEQGFGQRLEELVRTLDKKSFGPTLDLKPGMLLSMTMEKEGTHHKVPALVTSVDDDQVTIDYNHPLAGKALRYKVTLLKIEPNV